MVTDFAVELLSLNAPCQYCDGNAKRKPRGQGDSHSLSQHSQAWHSALTLSPWTPEYPGESGDSSQLLGSCFFFLNLKSVVCKNILLVNNSISLCLRRARSGLSIYSLTCTGVMDAGASVLSILQVRPMRHRDEMAGQTPTLSVVNPTSSSVRDLWTSWNYSTLLPLFTSF